MFGNAGGRSLPHLAVRVAVSKFLRQFVKSPLRILRWEVVTNRYPSPRVAVRIVRAEEEDAVLFSGPPMLKPNCLVLLRAPWRK